MKAEAFWMVYGDGCRAPSHKHTSHASACNEAQRLAMQVRGTRFYVLRSVDGYVMPPEQPERIEIAPQSDDLPF